MATLEAGTTPGAATNQHRHTEWNSVEILMSYLREYLPEKIQSYETTQQGGRRESKNPQWFARRQKLMHYDQQAKLQCNATLAKEHTRSPAIPQGPPRKSRTGVGKDYWPTRFSLTLPKWYLAASTTKWCVQRFACFMCFFLVYCREYSGWPLWILYPRLIW